MSREIASPTWYDLLGVEQDASPEQVRAAWKAAIGDLDPTDRRFRVLNDAAGVLLDPDRRAAYDAELAAAPQPEPVAAREPVVEPAPSAGAPRVPGWLLVVVGVLAAAALGLALALWLGDEAPAEEGSPDVTAAARQAAEQAAVPVLSYGWKSLDEDQAAARSYLTDDYREQYDQLFEVIRENAPTNRVTVTASVVGSGVVRSGEDRVQVLVFVNQTRTRQGSDEPTVFKNWATVTMERVGDDWLVDEMVSTPAGG